MSGEPARTDTARQHLAWLAHPVTLGALALLLVNDHLLKAAYPGVVTGKLSDVAGLVLAPPLLATLVTLLAPRAPAGAVAAVAVAVAGAGFAVVKAFPSAAAVASAGWSLVRGPSVVRADPTDLLALPALGVAWLVWTRSRRHPAPGRVARAVRLGVFLPAALVAVVATSAPPAPSVRYAVGVGPGLGGDAVILLSRVDDADQRRYPVANLISPDGRTWYHEVPATATTGPDPVPGYDAGVEVARTPRPADCAPGGIRCWRVVPGRLAIEESTDGGATWTTAWSVSGPRRERYLRVVSDAAREVDGYPIENLDREMTCTSVYAVPHSEVVIAACGLAGFVRRDVTGDWTMVGFDAGGSDLDNGRTSHQFANWILIILSGWFVLLLGAEAHALRHRRGPAPGVREAIAILIGLGCALLVVLARTDDLGFLTLLGLAFLFAGLLSWFIVYLVNRRGFPWWPLLLAVVAPAVAWELHGRIVRGEIYATPGWIAIWSVLLVALAAGLWLGIRLPRAPRPERPRSRPEPPPSGPGGSGPPANNPLIRNPAPGTDTAPP